MSNKIIVSIIFFISTVYSALNIFNEPLMLCGKKALTGTCRNCRYDFLVFKVLKKKGKGQLYIKFPNYFLTR